MAYHNLTNESGGSPDDRRTEADRLLDIIEQFQDELTPKEFQFVADMEGDKPVSTKQLFWLRDIKDKYL